MLQEISFSESADLRLNGLENVLGRIASLLETVNSASTNTSSFQFPKFDEVFWRIYKKYGTLSEREQFVLKEVYNIIVGNKPG